MRFIGQKVTIDFYCVRRVVPCCVSSVEQDREIKFGSKILQISNSGENFLKKMLI